MKKLIQYLAITLFFAVALYTRFYKLGSAPNTLIIDEAHYAYIAYSLSETGRDEHGSAYPIVFKGFGDYKLPAQVYALLPVIKIFGLNNFAARFPSAISGLLLVVVVYLLFREWQFSKSAAAFASLVTLISPWTFILSRFAFEANLALLFFALALLFIFKADKKPTLLRLLLAALFFALSIYAYVIYKFIAPCCVLFFAFYFFFKKKKYRSQILLFFLAFCLLIAPFVFGTAAHSNLARFKQIGIFANQQLIGQINENRDFCLKEYPKLLCYAFFNKGTVYLKELSHAFLKVYLPSYLFIEGDQNLIYMNVAGSGLFFLFLLPFYVLGILVFVQRFFKKKHRPTLLDLFLLLAFLLIPWPAVLSEVQKVRISTLFIFILVLMVMAYQFLLDKIKAAKFFNLIVFGLATLSFTMYFVNFISIHSFQKDFYYDSFVKGIFEFTDDYIQNNQVDEVVIQDFFSDPIMYYAYYRQVNPEVYQREVRLSKLEDSGFQHALALGKYRVADGEEPNGLACQAYADHKQVIYVDNHWNNKFHVIKTIKSSSGALNYAFIINLTEFGEELTKAGQCQ